MRDRRTTLSVILAALAIADVLVLVILTSGLTGSLTLGLLHLTLHRLDTPLRIGVAFSVWLLIREWRRPVWRRFGFVLITTFGLFALLSIAIHAPPFKAVGDIALTELYVLLALKHGLLVGPYSRFGWHHPGPLYFWIQIPLYVLSGYRAAGLYAGAVAINLAALAALVWVTMREDGGVLAVLVALGSLWFPWRVIGLVASPWTAHVPVLPSLTFIVAAAALASGRLRVFPLVILFGSFIAQTHVAFVPLVIVLGAGALTTGVVWPPDRSRSPWPMVTASACLFAALWLPPIVEQASHAGNFTQLWLFFVTDHRPSEPFGVSLAYWSQALLAGLLRPRVSLPWGGQIQPTDGVWTIAGAVMLVSLLPVVAIAACRAGRRFEMAIAAAALVGSLVGLWSVTRIRESILPHEIFWLTGLGMLNVAIIAAGGIHAWGRRWWPWRRPNGDAVAPGLVVVVCALVVCGAAWIGVRDFHGLVDYEGTKRRDMAEIVTADASIRQYIAAQQIALPLFDISGVWGTAASTFVELEKAGTPFAVAGAWLWMYTDTYAPKGQEDALLTMARFGRHRELSTRPGNVVVLEQNGLYIDAIRLAKR